MEAKAIEVGKRVTASVDVPVPVKVTVCGEPVALSATDREAVNAPAAAGLNSTDTVQVAVAASDVVQVFAEMMKELLLVPVIVSEVSVTAPVPVLVIVTI